jgi:NADPH-dependent glutamate synthase beta subunit-like oxidoreductase
MFRMKYQSVISVLLVLAGVAVQAAPSTFPVCIVGAGPSGLIAANKLEAKGQQVVVFDKRDSVGGKSQAYYDPYVPVHSKKPATNTDQRIEKMGATIRLVGFCSPMAHTLRA